MDEQKHWIKRWGRFAWVNVDAILVMLAASVVIALEVLGNPDPEAVSAVTLGLLGVTAFILLRQRVSTNQLDEITSYVQDQRSDKPYEVLEESMTWDLDGDHGETGTVTKTQKLRFTRDEVSMLDSWTSGPGQVLTCAGEYRLSSNANWTPMAVAHEFTVRGGRKYLYCLNHERSRGDSLQFRIKRTIRDRFPQDHESVSLSFKAPSVRPRMSVIWPERRPPRSVELSTQNGVSKKALTPVNRPDGRVYVDEQVAGETGQKAVISWSW